MIDKDNCGCTPPPVIGVNGHWECTPIPDTCKPVELTNKLVKEMYEKNINTEAFTTIEKAQLAMLHGNVGGPNGAIKEIVAGDHVTVDSTDPTKPIISTYGSQGPVGPSGADGAKGPKGDIGSQGPQGPKGPKGEGIVIKGADTKANIYLKSGKVGDTWIVTDVTDNGKGLVSNGAGAGQKNWALTPAIKGPKGATGAAGAAGPQGPKGTDGVKGDTGSQGPKGLDGVGKNGKDGSNGKDGTGVTIKGTAARADILSKQAPAGDMWLIDDLGATHGHGLVSDGATPTNWTDVGEISGPEGQQGQQGHDGAIGPIGPQGIPGPQGQGTQGIQGPQGQDGSKGPKGDQGVPGPQGPKGDQGSQGPKGTDGVKGSDGAKGQAGTGVTIKGSANLPTIQATPGNAGDMWICTDTGVNLGHGYVSDGLGAGAAHWTDVGTIAGPKGPKGDKGVQGIPGIDSTVAGPAGVQGPQGNQGPQGTATVDFASNQETQAGSVADKATTPASIASAYVPKTGGDYTGSLNFMGMDPTKGIYLYTNPTDLDYLIKLGTTSSGDGGTFYNQSTGAYVDLPSDGSVKLSGSGGIHAKDRIYTDNNIQVNYASTGWAEIVAKDGSQLAWKVGTYEAHKNQVVLKSYTNSVVLQPGSKGSSGVIVKTDNSTWNEIVGRSGSTDKWKIGVSSKGGNKIMLKSYKGDLDLQASNGDVTVNGKNVVTGSLSGTHLKLYL